MMPHSATMILTVLLPVRNEGINLKIMLQILHAVMKEHHEVLVVVDRLDDASIPVVTALQSDYPHLKWLHNQKGAGVVNAIRTGVEAASGHNILIFAADEVGPVLAIEDMLALIQVDQCDFVSCTRYAHGGKRLGGSFIGGLLSKLANKLFHRLTGSAFTDATTGIKMFRREIFSQLDLRCRPVGWAVAFEMAIKAQHRGLRLGEVPIVSIDRLYGGESTFRLGPWVKEYFKWFWWGLRESWRQRKEASSAVKVRVPSYYR